MKQDKILFSLNMTNNCNLKCDYCIQTTRNNKNNIKLNIDHAIEYIDIFLSEHKEYTRVKIDFFGGEPTLMKKQIIDFLNKIIKKKYKDKLEFTITTNSFIFFPEYFIFMKENNIKYFNMIISYDLSGQFKRSKNELINNIIKNNILKYKKLCVDLNFNLSDRLKLVSCLTEKNVELLYEYFIEYNYNLNIDCLNVTTVFPEYWKKESFSKLNNQIKKIYNHLIETKNKNLNFAYIRFPYSDISSKQNTLSEGKNTLSFHKVEVLPYDEKINEYFFHKDSRGTKKNVLKIKKEIYNLIYNIYDYRFNLFEINLFKNYSCNQNIFNILTLHLLSGGNLKRYKNEIYGLMYYNIFLSKEYYKLIKKIRNNIKINIYNEFIKNGIFYFIHNTVDNNIFNKILFIFKENILNLDLNNNILNSKNFFILYDDSIKGIGKNNKIDTIYINNNKHRSRLDTTDTLLHEIFHLYLCQIGIDEVFKKNNLQNITELLCENFIKIFKDYILNISELKKW